MSRAKFWGLALASVALSCGLFLRGMNLILSLWLTIVLWCWGIRMGIWAEEPRT